MEHRTFDSERREHLDFLLECLGWTQSRRNETLEELYPSSHPEFMMGEDEGMVENIRSKGRREARLYGERSNYGTDFGLSELVFRSFFGWTRSNFKTLYKVLRMPPHIIYKVERKKRFRGCSDYDPSDRTHNAYLSVDSELHI